jgi:hypothetical protein
LPAAACVAQCRQRVAQSCCHASRLQAQRSAALDSRATRCLQCRQCRQRVSPVQPSSAAQCRQREPRRACVAPVQVLERLVSVKQPLHPKRAGVVARWRGHGVPRHARRDQSRSAGCVGRPGAGRRRRRRSPPDQQERGRAGAGVHLLEAATAPGPGVHLRAGAPPPVVGGAPLQAGGELLLGGPAPYLRITSGCVVLLPVQLALALPRWRQRRRSAPAGEAACGARL